MFATEYFPPLVLGGFFVLFGLVFLCWSKKEEKAYHDSLMYRRDLREFITGWPPRRGAMALKLGGWISLSIGIPLLIVAVVLWLQTR